MGIFGIAKKGFGMLGKSSKTSPTIKSVKPKANKDSAHKIELKKIHYLKKQKILEKDLLKLLNQKVKNNVKIFQSV